MNAAELVSYDVIKETLVSRRLMTDNWLCHLLSAFAAGFCATCVASPVDVVKTRYMNSTAGVYRGALHCAASMLRERGLFTFYKGYDMLGRVHTVGDKIEFSTLSPVSVTKSSESTPSPIAVDSVDFDKIDRVEVDFVASVYAALRSSLQPHPRCVKTRSPAVANVSVTPNPRTRH